MVANYVSVKCHSHLIKLKINLKELIKLSKSSSKVQARKGELLVCHLVTFALSIRRARDKKELLSWHGRNP